MIHDVRCFAATRGRIFNLVLCLGVGWMSLSCITSAIGQTVTIHVSPRGNDSWEGSPAHPLATLTGARNAARRLRGTSPKPCPIRIVIADGTYPMTGPLELTPQDSGTEGNPVVYEAAAGTEPVFTGGILIGNWKPCNGGTWEASIPQSVPAPCYFEGLWVNDRRATRARYPNSKWSFLGKVREERFPNIDDKRGQKARQTIALDQNDFEMLSGLGQAELKDVNLVIYHKWDVTRRRIEGVDRSNLTVNVEGNARKTWNAWDKGTPYILENLLPAMDAPGEWFLSRDGILHYKPKPGETVNTARIVAPLCEKLVVLKGDPKAGHWVEHIQFRGLHFLHAQGILPKTLYEPLQSAAAMEAAIMADGTRQVVFENCEIAHTGAWGIWFRSGCVSNTVRSCLLKDLGAGGIRIGETSIPDQEARRTGRMLIDNNIIFQGGMVNASAAGILVCHSADNRITHNEIADLFYTGISVGWTWGYGPSPSKRNLVAWNNVHRIGKGLLSDMGGFYSLGRSEGTVIRNNVFHDIDSYGYGGWGLYTDEGSTGVLFENNLVYNTKSGGFHQHYGSTNTVRNNIFLNSRDQQLQATRVENHLSFTFQNNIIEWSTGANLAGPWDKIRHISGSNCYWNASGKAVDFLGRPLSSWQDMGHEQGSIVADPMFNAPGEGDFRLSSKSPALKLGFKPFDYTQAGVYGNKEWIAKAKAISFDL